MKKPIGNICSIAHDIYLGKLTFESSSPFWKGMSARNIEIPWLMSKLRTIPHQRMLDVGFSLSDLEYLRILLDFKKHENVDLWAIDIIEPQHILNRYPPEWIHEIKEVPIIIGDVRNTPLPENAFDLVLCISTIEHVGYDKASVDNSQSAFSRAVKPDKVDLKRDDNVEAIVLESFRKALTPGGYLLLTAPVGNSGAVLLKDSLGLFCAQFEYSEKTWTRISKAQGYKVVDEAFFALTDNKKWVKCQDISCLKNLEAVQFSHSSGCGLIILQKE